ncbi:ubiquinol-cytochrome C chaperone-domain-containing protein [Podospora didyma]|uniref:Ubiquinol-cytochrome C chaperone-domain-containing protein n=1 Tax=Podospora didyma TaxID=330526 RepID=A0AAE0KEZ2_9PEZI|nr:ubiquinol-cytochrome C chaperone-domain-containing protein [Podospora didyma]
MACLSCSSSLGSLPRSLRQTSIRRILPSSSSSSSSCPRATTSVLLSPHVTFRRLHDAPGRRPDATSSHNSVAPGDSSVGIVQRLKNKLGSVARASAGSYMVYGTTERLIKACASQAKYSISETDRREGNVKTAAEGEEVGVGGGMWHEDFHLLPTFSTWAQVTMLHMYLLVVRLRNMDPDAHALWQSQLVDFFFATAEDKMAVEHGLAQRGVRQRFLKDLFVQWRGLMLAYDEGLVRGDAVLASAVWRNLFKAREDIDVRALGAVVSWMRVCLQELDKMDEVDLHRAGESVFRKFPAKAELAKVDRLTAALKTPTTTAAADGAEKRPTTTVAGQAV